jgi:hypothetical protein
MNIMKYNSFILVLILFACGKNRNDALRVTFSPAFVESCDLEIDRDSLRFTIFKERDDTIKTLHYEAIKVDSMMMDSLNYIFKNFRFTLAKWDDGYTDTSKFEKGIYEGDSVEYELEGLGADGVSVRGIFNLNNQRRRFDFWSPDAGTDKHKVASELIYLMDRSLQTEQSHQYLERLKFFFDLPTTFSPW